MLFKTPLAALVLFASASLVAASESDVSHRALDSETLPVLDVSPSRNTTHVIRKRGLLDGLFCAIGVLSSCSTTISIDTTSDRKNCGTLGNVCPSSFANGVGSVTCSSSTCISACASGFGFSPDSAGCISLKYDVNNCGAIGNACNYNNAVSACVLGKCALASCNSGFVLSGAVCKALNYNTDINNCGSIGTVCSATGGASSVSCVSGSCKINTCGSGYTLSNNACTAIPTTSDVKNCGAVGRQCASSYSNGVGSTCVAGVCQPERCAPGYAFDVANSACRGVLSDSKNCGAIGTVCTVVGGVAGCQDGACTTLRCTSPYKLVNGICTTSASARARVKKSKIAKPIQLCPGSESACPIVGSASFLIAQASGFESFRAPHVSSLDSVGGYECLNTQDSLESCGGCTSMGEGMNCQQIARSSGVGCSAGRCVVFSCESGYVPNHDATGCVKVSSPARTRRASGHAKRSHTHHHRRHSKRP